MHTMSKSQDGDGDFIAFLAIAVTVMDTVTAIARTGPGGLTAAWGVVVLAGCYAAKRLRDG
jgi:hypothetical protein